MPPIGKISVTTIAAAPRTSETRTAATGRIAGLDGLRALAVILVVVYHLMPGRLHGGFIGVDVFFVLSGFLITTILWRESQATGRLSLRRFWVHRARRLLPALAAVVLASVSVVALAAVIVTASGSALDGTVWGDLLVGVGAQTAAAASFTSNWLTVATGQSYAAAGSPQLLANLWSLGVEEQFYLLWPLAVAAVLAAGIALRRAAAGALALALASAVAMAAAFTVEDPTRAYVGTDTHAFGLMIGAALAFWWAGHARDEVRVRVKAGGLVAGLLGLLSLGALATWMAWDSPWAYRGGMLAASVATAGVILMVVAVPAAGRVLDAGPLRWVGERSYGIYLWHWPVLVIAAAAFDGGRVALASPLTVAVTLAVTLAAAAASHRWIEMPVRRMGLRRALRMMRAWLSARGTSVGRTRLRTRRLAAFVAATTVALGLATAGIALAPARTSLEAQLDAGASAVGAGGADATPASSRAAHALIVPPIHAGSAAHRGASGSIALTRSGFAIGPDGVPDGRAITVIGDSVTLGSAAALQESMPGIEIDAEVGKQFAEGAARVGTLAERGRLRDFVVVALGTNGPVDAADVERLVRAAGDRPVIMVTPYGDRTWMPGSQRAVRDAASRFDTVLVADWQRAAERDTGLLGPDGIHPRASGTWVLVDLVRDALQDAVEVERRAA